MKAEPAKGPIRPGAMLFLAGCLAGLLAAGFATAEIAIEANAQLSSNRDLATRRPARAPDAPAVATLPELPEIAEVPATVEPEAPTTDEEPEDLVPAGALFDPLERSKPIIEIEGVPAEVLDKAPVPRSLNPAAATLQSIQAQVSEGQPLLDACYADALALDPSLEGLWTLTLELNPSDGAAPVPTVTAEGRDRSDPAFEACLIEALRGQDYGEVGRTVTVTRRVNFNATP